MNYLPYQLLPRDTAVCTKKAFTVCMRTRILCKTMEFSFLRRKINFNSFATLPCAHAQVMPFRITTFEMPCALHAAHVTLHPVLFFLSARVHSSLSSRTALSDQRPYFLHCFTDCSFSYFCPLSATNYCCSTANPGVDDRSPRKSHLPSLSFLFPSNLPILSFLFALYSFSPCSSSDAVRHLFHNFSLSIFVLSI